MGDEREWRTGIYHKEEDFSEQTKQALESAQSFAEAGKLPEAVETLLAMEKTTRLGGDTKSTILIARRLVQLLVTHHEWQRLMELLEVLVKKRGQMKQVVGVLVQESVNALPQTQKATQIELIQKLRSITEGKIHVELEYARLTVQLADIWDADGRLQDAYGLLQGLQVDTIGNMDRKEKFDIILHQVEMCLRVKDYVVANIISKKIPPRTLDKDDTIAHKIRYYELLIQFYTHEKNYFMLSHCYGEIYATVFRTAFSPDVVGNRFGTTEEKLQLLEHVALYLVLSPYTATREEAGAEREKPALLQKYRKDPRLEELPAFFDLVDLFVERELILWPEFEQKYVALKGHPVFATFPERWQELHKRVTEHNISVVSAFYSKISLERLALVVGMNTEETEGFLCEMVTEKMVFAKINRVTQIVDFVQRKNAAQSLTNWNDGITQVLELLDTTCHLIAKQRH